MDTFDVEFSLGSEGSVCCSEGGVHSAADDDSGDERKECTQSGPKPKDISVESSLRSEGSVCCSEGGVHSAVDGGNERKEHTQPGPKPQDISVESSLGSEGSVCCSEGGVHNAVDVDSGDERKEHTQSGPKPQDISAEGSLGSGGSVCCSEGGVHSAVDDDSGDERKEHMQSGPIPQDISVEENIDDGLRSVTDSRAFGKIGEINTTVIDQKFEKVNPLLEQNLSEISDDRQNCDKLKIFTESLENKMLREYFASLKISFGKLSSSKSMKRLQKRLRNKTPVFLETFKDLNVISQKTFCGSTTTHVPFHCRNKTVDVCIRRRKTAKNKFLKYNRLENTCCYCNGRKIADRFCEDCCISACLTCIARLHPAYTPRHDHVVRPVDFRFRCRCHREPYKYFCTTCDMPLCENKMLQGHRAHVVESLTTFISTEREHLRKSAKTIGEFCLKKADLCLSEIEHQRELSELKWILDKERVQMEFASLRDMLVEQENVILRHMETGVCSRKDRLHELTRAYGDIIHQEAKLTSQTLQVISDPSKYNFLFKKGKTVKEKWAKLEDYARALPCHTYPDTEKSYQQLPFSLFKEKDDIYRYLRAYAEELGLKEKKDKQIANKIRVSAPVLKFKQAVPISGLNEEKDKQANDQKTKETATHTSTPIFKQDETISPTSGLNEEKDKQANDQKTKETATHTSTLIFKQDETISPTSVIESVSTGDTTPAPIISTSCGPIFSGKNTLASTVQAMSQLAQRTSSAGKEKPTFGFKFSPNTKSSTKSFSDAQSTTGFKCASETSSACEAKLVDECNLTTGTKSTITQQIFFGIKGCPRITSASEVKPTDGYKLTTGTKSPSKQPTTLGFEGRQRTTSTSGAKPTDGYNLTTGTKSTSKQQTYLGSKTPPKTTSASEAKSTDGYDLTTGTKSTSKHQTYLGFKTPPRTTSASENQQNFVFKFTAQIIASGTSTRKKESNNTQSLVGLNFSSGTKLSAETLSNDSFKVKPKQQTTFVDSFRQLRTTDLWDPPSTTLCRASHWEYTFEVTDGTKNVLWNQQRTFREGDIILNGFNVFQICPGKSYLLKVTPHYMMESFSSSGDVITGKPTRILILSVVVVHQDPKKEFTRLS